MCGKRKKVVHAASISPIFSLSSKQKKKPEKKKINLIKAPKSECSWHIQMII